MYTTTIIIMIFISILLILIYKDRLNFYKLLWVVPFCCLISYIQFIYCNNIDKIRAWEFNQEHIIGFSILNTEIEDYFFTIVISIILFVIHSLIDRGINYKSSTLLKGVVIGFLVSLVFFFDLIGDEFGKSQIYYMCIALFFIILCFDSLDVRQLVVTLSVSLLIAGSWDIWAGNCKIQQWYYIDNITGEHSNLFRIENWWWVKIGKAQYPISIMPQYYISGALFFEGVMLITNKFFTK